MTKLWFKAKHYGYGWYPASIEGWLVTLGFVVLILAPQAVLWLIGPENIQGELFAALYVPYTVILTGLLIYICAKTGEEARWRWGK